MGLFVADDRDERCHAPTVLADLLLHLLIL